MATTDPIADMLTRIRNAAHARHKSVDVPSSGMKQEIVRILTDRGYIKKYVVLEDGRQGVIRMLLNYKDNESVIRGLVRASKPGRRLYRKSAELPRVLNGLGTAIVSTSKGVLTEDECRKLKVGGEVLCKVW